MDEAVNSLDKKTEALVTEQIKDLKGKTAIILISHDKNSLKYCDKVLYIKNQGITQNF